MTLTTDSSTRPVVLRAGAIFDGHSDALSGPTDILIRDGVIAEIAESITPPAEADVIDLSDRTVSPGFIDTHVHTQLTPDRLLAIYQLESSAMKALHALPVLTSILHSGFTTVRDAASLDASFSTVDLKRAVDAGLIEGPRMIVAPHMLSGTAGHSEMCLVHPEFRQPSYGTVDGVDNIRTKVRQEVYGGADWIKVSLSGFAGARGGDGPDDMAWSQEELDAAVETARDYNVDTCVHALGDRTVLRAIRSGARSIEHGSLASEETLETLASSDVFLVPTMHATRLFLTGEVADVTGEDGTAVVVDRPKFGLFLYDEELAAGQKRIGASNAKIAFGSDSGAFPHADAWKEFTAMTEAGMSNIRALRAATSVAAELLRRPDLGRIEVGATADIIALAGDPLVDIEATGRVEFVMKQGRIYKQR